MSVQFYDLAEKLPDYQETIETKLASLRTSQHGAIGKVDQLLRRTADELQAPESKEPSPGTNGSSANPSSEKAKPEPVPVEVHQPARGSLEMLRSVVGPAPKWLASGVMALVVLIFMLLGREDLRNRVIRLAGTDRMDLTTNALDEAANRVSKYLSMQLKVNCCFGLLNGAYEVDRLKSARAVARGPLSWALNVEGSGPVPAVRPGTSVCTARAARHSIRKGLVAARF